MNTCFPNPLVAASIYCAGRLDEAVSEALTPFWQALEEESPEAGCYLWFLRYAKGGEHLKVRLHGPEELAGPSGSLLAEHVERWLEHQASKAAEEGEVGDRSDGVQAPPIDPEDELDQDHQDLSYLRTTYRRSPVVFGGGPFPQDDHFVTRFTRALGAASVRAFEVLACGPQGRLRFRERYEALLELVREALRGVGLAPDRRGSYQAYHRDWLIRAAVSRSPSPSAMVRTVLEHLDLQLQRRKAGTEVPVQREVPTPSHDGGPPWAPSVAFLFDRAVSLCRTTGCRPDPFAPEAAFAPLFKLLHGVANAVGLSPLNEALVYHDLLGEGGQLEAHRDVRLTP